MSYTKNTWASGDVVTAAKLNNLEDGVSEALAGGGGGGDVMIVPVTVTYEDEIPTYSTDVAYTDVIAALKAGKAVFYRLAGEVDGEVYFELEGDLFYNSAETFVAFRNLYHAADGITTEEPNGE